jgi:TonB family protein
MYGDGTGGDGGNVRGDGQGIVLKIARWVWRPTVADLAPFNPRVATDAHIVGDVLLVCRVRLNRHVHDCRVLAERPSGYELGAAAIAASHIFRVWPAKQAGKAIDDAWVVVPAHYDFADPKH